MDGDQLGESTLHPDGQRTLIRYTVESAEKELNRMAYLESNKNELLKDIKVNKIDLIG